MSVPVGARRESVGSFSPSSQRRLGPILILLLAHNAESQKWTPAFAGATELPLSQVASQSGASYSRLGGPRRSTTPRSASHLRPPANAGTHLDFALDAQRAKSKWAPAFAGATRLMFSQVASQSGPSHWRFSTPRPCTNRRRALHLRHPSIRWGDDPKRLLKPTTSLPSPSTPPPHRRQRGQQHQPADEPHILHEVQQLRGVLCAAHRPEAVRQQRVGRHQ
jgi:hypothetical protein